VKINYQLAVMAYNHGCAQPINRHYKLIGENNRHIEISRKRISENMKRRKRIGAQYRKWRCQPAAKNGNMVKK